MLFYDSSCRDTHILIYVHWKQKNNERETKIKKINKLEHTIRTAFAIIFVLFNNFEGEISRETIYRQEQGIKESTSLKT